MTVGRNRLVAMLGELLGDEDAEFADDMEFEDALGYTYGRLLEEGCDPDELLIEYGVLEESGETE